VPGEPAAAAAQILLARFDIVLGTARRALRVGVRDSGGGLPSADSAKCRLDLLRTRAHSDRVRQRRQGYSPLAFVLLWAQLNKYSDSTILLSLGPAAAAAEQTAWRGVKRPPRCTAAPCSPAYCVFLLLSTTQASFWKFSLQQQ
jgi:hypothetical protein